jgi:hypothetical protein
MPNQLILLGIILVVVVGLITLKKYLAPSSPPPFPYRSRISLCSPAERSLLGVLEQLLNDKYRVLSKVRLADLIGIRKGGSRSQRQSALNRISRKHVDFVVCDINDLSILGVVELDDQSHNTAERQKRDSFLDGALHAADIPIVHIQAQNTYSVIELHNQLRNGFAFMTTPHESTPPMTAPDPSDPGKTPSVSDDTETIEVCADCGAALVKHKARKGKYAGQYFLACANFPKCRKIFPVKQAAKE